MLSSELLTNVELTMDWIEELDDLLATVEDTAKGSEGDMITKARGMILEQHLKAGQHETIVIGDSWISLEEKLPQQDQFILLYDKMFDKIDVWLVDKDPNLIDADYTHWLPLPDPPKSQ